MAQCVVNLNMHVCLSLSLSVSLSLGSAHFLSDSGLPVSQLPPSVQYLLPSPPFSPYTSSQRAHSPPHGLPRVLSNPSLHATSSSSAPPHWPSPDEPLFSLANVLSLAMSVAQSFMPSPGTSNQGFHPHQQGLSPASQGTLSPPVSATLAPELHPQSHSFSPATVMPGSTSQLPPAPSALQPISSASLNPAQAENQQGALPGTVDPPQVGGLRGRLGVGSE